MEIPLKMHKNRMKQKKEGVYKVFNNWKFNNPIRQVLAYRYDQEKTNFSSDIEQKKIYRQAFQLWKYRKFQFDLSKKLYWTVWIG